MTGSGGDARALVMRQWVQRYAEVRGWALIPVHRLVGGGGGGGECTCGAGAGCASPGKHADVETLERLGVSVEEGLNLDSLVAGGVGAWGNRNIGVSCGSASGLVGVNVQAGDVAGESWRRLGEEWLGGDVGVESTLTVATPGGGRIVLFSSPPGLRVDANRLELDGYPGVSILGDGGYAILPPSDGWTYDHGGTPTDRITPVPAGLLVRLAAEEAVVGGVAGWVDTDNPFLSGVGRTLSDTGNGRRLVDQWGEGLAYTSGLGWRVWVNHRWTERLADEYVVERAKEIPFLLKEERRALELRLPAGDPDTWTDAEKRAAAAMGARIDALRKWENGSRGLARVMGAKKSAETDPRVLRAVDTWDRHAGLLGVPNGVIELETGELRPMERSLWISKYGNIAYEPGASRRGSGGDEFLEFIDFVTGGDEEYALHLQVWAGYSLTGSMREKAILFCPGPGNTGKTTFADMLTGIAGDYARVIDSRLINLQDRSGNVETSTIPLIGTRIAVAADIPTYDFNADFMKKLSGGDTITGRAMRQNMVSFVSPAKLWIFSNHYPSIRDKQLMERFRVLPFTNVSGDRNRRRSEWTQRHTWTDGIAGTGGNAIMRAALDWCVQGARIALRESEIPYSSVAADAKSRYEANGDIFWPYVNERARVGEGLCINLNLLYEDYTAWVAETRFLSTVPLRPAFENILVERGFRVENGMVEGITVSLMRVDALGIGVGQGGVKMERG